MFSFSPALFGSLAGVATVRLPERPRLAPWLTVIDLGDRRIQLRAADFALTISEPLLSGAFRHVAAKLDGSHSVQEICSAGAPTYLDGTVEFLLKMLRQAGALHEGMPLSGLLPAARQRFDSALRFFAHYSANAEQVLLRLQAAVVLVGGSEELCHRLVASLEATGVGRVVCVSRDALTGGSGLPSGAPVDLVIAATETPDTAFFKALNATHLASGVRWLRVAFEGSSGVLGPTVVPGQTACFACYERRKAMHDATEHLERYHEQVAVAGEGNEGVLAGLRDTLVGQVALESARLLAGFAPPATLARFHIFQATTPEVTGHDVLRVPRCASCGPRRAPRDPWDGRARLDPEAP